MIRVFLQKLAGQELQAYDVDPQSSLSDLKKSVQESDPVALRGVAIYFLLGAISLSQNGDERSLQDCGVVDGSTLILVILELTAKLWSTATGGCTQTFSGHSDAVFSVVFSGDGSAVLTASIDATSKLWSIATGECTHTFSGHSGGVRSAEFSEDGSAVHTA